MSLSLLWDPKVRRGLRFTRLRPFLATGELSVSPGQEVSWDTALGSFSPSQRLRSVRVEASDESITATVLVEEGKQVKRGEVLAYYSYLFGLGYTEYISPCDGEVVSVSQRLGLISIKEAPVSLISHLPGRVKTAEEAWGAWVESEGDLLEGAVGAGHGRSGILNIKVQEPGKSLPGSAIKPEDAGTVVVTGGAATQDLLEACLRYRVAGLIAGGVSYRVFQWYSELVETLDWDEFLARYWARDAKRPDTAPSPIEIVPTLVVTEGYGEVPIGQDAFGMLSEHANRSVFVDGAGKPGRSGYGTPRPCVFIPVEGKTEDSERAAIPRSLAVDWVQGQPRIPGRVAPGEAVTVIDMSGKRQPGVLVESTPREMVLDNGVEAYCVRVQMPGGALRTVPVFNLILE